MNNKKFCFIICTNSEMFLKECVLYINDLNVPEQYELEIISIQDACGITEAYNAAMNDSNAKYKIYLHQDNFIINQNILFDILKIFESEIIGMIGVFGCVSLPETGVMWETNSFYGNIYECNILSLQQSKLGNKSGLYEKVQVLDGVLMITQYDIRWREDLFKDWDFYDASQSLEFQRKGYDIVVANQELPWCIHDCGIINFQNYEKNRLIFLEEYYKNKKFY